MQCTKCKGKFEPPENIVMTNCPFCQSPLASVAPQVTPDSNEAKILQIVQERGAGIYLKKEFIGLILDYFPNDDFGRLLKAVIERQGAVYVSKLKDYPADEIQFNYVKILDKLSKESFIAKEVLAPAVELLCFGLGYSVKSPATQASPTTQTPPPPTTQTPPPPPTQQPPTTQASPLSDFEIENGVLIKYIGKDNIVVIPNSVTSIGEGAFYKYTALSQITIPDTVTSIGDGAFSECTYLTQVTIPNLVTSIGDFAFQFCESLSQVTIPDSVTSIGDSSFSLCTSLSQVTIPDSVTRIGEGAFGDCYNLPEDVVQQIKKISPLALVISFQKSSRGYF